MAYDSIPTGLELERSPLLTSVGNLTVKQGPCFLNFKPKVPNIVPVSQKKPSQFDGLVKIQDANATSCQLNRGHKMLVICHSNLLRLVHVCHWLIQILCECKGNVNI